MTAKLAELRGRHERVAVAYADCGSYGALDAALAGTGIERLAGDTCYDLFGLDEVRDALAEEPGTYFLTDFLARTFEHTVWRSLGLDRYPELRDDYFHSYTPLHLARAAPDARAAPRGRARRRAARPAARGARGRRGRAGARARAHLRRRRGLTRRAGGTPPYDPQRERLRI